MSNQNNDKKRSIKELINDPKLPEIKALGFGHYEMEGREFSTNSYGNYDENNNSES